jgi:hypothetical protein
MGQKVKTEDLIDKVNIRTLIEFLEYEEAFTKDKETANRIQILLKLIGIWN